MASRRWLIVGVVAAMVLVPLVILGSVMSWLPRSKVPVPELVASVPAPVDDAPAAMRGRVVDDEGEPVSGARVWLAGPAAPSVPLAETTSARDGRFSFATVPARDKVLVAAEHEGFSSAVVGPVPPTDQAVLITLGASRSVRGTVKNEDGVAVAGAVITTDGPVQLARRATSGPDGGYEMWALPREATTLTVHAAGYATAQLTVPEGGRLDVVLKREAELAGKVVDPDGRPARAQLRACEGKKPEEHFATKADGTFTIPMTLAACPFVAESDEFAPSVPTTPTSDGVTLKLRVGGGIKGRVVDGEGAAVTKFFVGVDAFTPEGRDDVSVRSGEALTGEDPDGAFSLPKLAPGRYVLSYGSVGGAPARSKPIHVSPGAHTTVTLVVFAGGVVRGRVVGVDGVPLEGVKVALDATVSAGAMPPGVTTDATGAFSLEQAPEGPFSVRFSKPGLRTRLVSGLRFGDQRELSLGDVALTPAGEKAGGPEVSGIGGVLRQTRDGVAFGAVIEGSPAFLAGVRQGDLVRKIDGQSAGAMSLSDLTQRLRGEPGTVVRLVLERDGTRLEVKVTRAVIAF